MPVYIFTTFDDPSATTGTFGNRHQRYGPDRREYHEQRPPTRLLGPVAAARIPPSTIPRPQPRPLHKASTTKARSSGGTPTIATRSRLPPRQRCLHPPRRSLGHPRHRCIRHQRSWADRRGIHRQHRRPTASSYSGGTYTTLDDPLATNGTFAFGINALGQIVGAYRDASGSSWLPTY